MPLSSTSTSFDYTTTNIPAFLSKLWTLVEDSKYDELIAWDPSGFSFHVFDQNRFSREILPRFFKHNNMASFIRQLNMYGFRKVNSIDHGSLKNEKDDMEFHHAYFIRGKEQFLEFIKRKVPDIKQMSTQVAPIANVQPSQLTNEQTLSLQYPPNNQIEDLNKVLDDVNVIKSKQKIVDESLSSVKKENEALWKEITSLRQKHHHQQQIVNKLIHFLVHLVNPSTLGIKRTRPLMIDSHSNSFILTSDEDQFNNMNDGNDDVDEDDEDELQDSGRNNFNLQDKQLVELEDDNDTSSMNMNEEKLKTYIAETEIETININKQMGVTVPSSVADINLIGTTVDVATLAGGTSSSSSSSSGSDNVLDVNVSKKVKATYAESSLLQPLAKKLKATNLSQPLTSNGDLTTHVPLNYVFANQSPTIRNETDLNKDKSSLMPNVVQPSFLDTSLFLNQASGGKEEINSASPATPSHINIPIVTLPDSPAQNIVHTNNPNNSSINSMDQQITAQQSTNIMNNNTNINNNNNSNNSNAYRRALSSNQMNDHIESLQIDLNSIKEFLSNNSFNNQIDTYTINNLFSPIALDQIENESYYMEHPLSLGGELNAANSSVTNASNCVSSYVNDPGQVDSTAAIQNNGKIVGNELIQYDSFHSAEFFDELFNGDSTVSNSKEMKQQIPPTPIASEATPSLGPVPINVQYGSLDFEPSTNAAEISKLNTTRGT